MRYQSIIPIFGSFVFTQKFIYGGFEMIIGGGFRVIWYSIKAAKTTGFRKMLKASFSKNTCKSCALGMGGQKGGMTDESGSFPEICKKSFQAQITDIQSPIPIKFFHEKSIDDIKKIAPRILARSGRLNTPLYKAKGDSHYSPVSWEHALEKITSKLKTTSPERSFFYSSGRSSSEAAFLMQLFARMYGTNNLNNSSYYCHQATGAGIHSTIGTATATIQLEDLEKADLIFVIGANPASNHPRFIRQLMKCRRRGGKIIVINPVVEKGLIRFAVPSNLRSMLAGGSSIASEYIQIPIGSDIALMKGLAKAVLEEGNQNDNFMQNHTNGHAEFLSDIENTSWDTIESKTNHNKKRICEIAAIYGKSKNVIFSWSVGITHHLHGVENIESVVNLALLRGMIGRKHAGLMPLRGHSNVQGVGSVGVVPVLKGEFLKNIEKNFGISIPSEPGMDTMSCMKAAYDGKIDFAFMMGGNLYYSNPDTAFAKKALNAISFKVFLSTTLNRGHFYGVDQEAIILPVVARDEETQQTSQESLFNYVRLSDGGIPRMDNVRSEVEIISEIAQKVLGNETVDFECLKQHQNLRKLIAETVPGFEQMGASDQIDSEFQISGRTFHEPVFATANGKANFRICAIPELTNEKNEFRMMTVRSEGQFNSIIYDEEDEYRGQKSRKVVLMNESDIEKNNLHENDLVTLESSVGKMEKLKVRKFDIARGNVLTYYPESNVLVPNTTDPRSKTPGYKSVCVKITKYSGLN